MGKIPNTNCYLVDILIATVGTACDHSKLVLTRQKTLDDEALSIKWEKCHFLMHEIEWLGFKINNLGTNPLIHKTDAVKKKLKEPKGKKDIRSLMGSTEQFNKLIPILATLNTVKKSNAKNKKKVYGRKTRRSFCEKQNKSIYNNNESTFNEQNFQ